jgi:hypothetical protein
MYKQMGASAMRQVQDKWRNKRRFVLLQPTATATASLFLTKTTPE